MALKTALVLLPLVLHATAKTPCTSPLIATSEADIVAFTKITYDYIIVGGGTAGLALAARLAEDPLLNIGVIEAGILHIDDQIIDLPAFSGAGNATYDWMFKSSPQENAAGRVLALPRGKMVGGSSSINSMAWGRASSVEYDALKEFSPQHGWSWAELLPYFKKAEHLAILPGDPYPGITAADAARALVDSAVFDGFTGPIAASHNDKYPETALKMAATFNTVGVKTNPAPLSGNTTGVWNSFLSFDRTAGVRSYSARGYYCSHSRLRNLRVLTNAQATKIHFSSNKAGIVANGVEFVAGHKKAVTNATREVVLSAGTVQTPQLLELSGIGDSNLLKSLRIPMVQDLPGVGENLQEHLFVGVQWQVKPEVRTFDILRINTTFLQEQTALYDRSRTGLLTENDSTLSFLPLSAFANATRLRQLLEVFDRSGQNDTSDIRQLQDRIAREWFSIGNAPAVEIIEFSKGFVAPAPNTSYVTLLGGIVHPSSRGSVHIDSSDPLAAPVIDPNFLSREFDTQVLLDVLKFMMKLGKSEPFSDLVALQNVPSPDMQSDEDLLSFIRASAAGADHLIGTAAMAPRTAGGVVDGTFKVYGTTNLRVVDASVIPIQLGCHTQATVYAIAEKAAEMIRSSRS